MELGGFEIHARKNKGGSFGWLRASTRVSRTRSSIARPVFTRLVGKTQNGGAKREHLTSVDLSPPVGPVGRGRGADS